VLNFFFNIRTSKITLFLTINNKKLNLIVFSPLKQLQNKQKLTLYTINMKIYFDNARQLKHFLVKNYLKSK
jgi:hypothetical protein